MRGHLTYNPETKLAQVECGQNGCKAVSTSYGATDAEDAARNFRLCDWRQDARGMWVCGKHKDGGAS